MRILSAIQSILVPILLTVSSNFCHAGYGGSGTGGGVEVRCTADPDNGFEKNDFYLLDYVLATKEQRQSWVVVGSKNNDSIERIKAHLNRVKFILKNLQDFGSFFHGNLNSITDFPERIRDRELWYPWDTKLKESEKIKGRGPMGCSESGDQVVTYRNGQLWYWGQGLSNLEQNSIEQYASLYTHEMLRMYGMDTEEVLKWTPVFHDSNFIGLSGDSMLEYLVSRKLITQSQFEKSRAVNELMGLNKKVYNDKYQSLIKELEQIKGEAQTIFLGYNENTDIKDRPQAATGLINSRFPYLLKTINHIYTYIQAYYFLDISGKRKINRPISWGFIVSRELKSDLTGAEIDLKQCISSIKNCSVELFDSIN